MHAWKRLLIQGLRWSNHCFQCCSETAHTVFFSLLIQTLASWLNNNRSFINKRSLCVLTEPRKMTFWKKPLSVKHTTIVFCVWCSASFQFYLFIILCNASIEPALIYLDFARKWEIGLAIYWKMKTDLEIKCIRQNIRKFKLESFKFVGINSFRQLSCNVFKQSLLCIYNSINFNKIL